MSDQKPPAGSSESSAAPVLTRRDFLHEVTAAALGVAGLGSAVVLYQYFAPNVLFEASPEFRAGNPDLFPINSVTFLQEQQVYIVRTPAGFYAVSAVCTHLGCVTQWKPEANQIACPCHGSKFLPDGKKIEGPAPAPLPHFALSLTADGELLVNKSRKVNPNEVLKT